MYSIEIKHMNTIIEIISKPQKPQINMYVHKNKITICIVTWELPAKSGPLFHCVRHPVSLQGMLHNAAALEWFKTKFNFISKAQLQLTSSLENDNLDICSDSTGWQY